MSAAVDATRGASARRAGLAILVALLAAGCAEFLLRHGGNALAAVVLYGFAALLVATTSTPFRLLAPVTQIPDDRAGLRMVLAVGSAVAAVLAGLTLYTLHGNLRDPAAPWLWLASLASLTVTGCAALSFETPSPRWLADRPATSRGRWLVLLVLLAILVAAAVARFVWLDRIPFGINPDEGDRAASAAQVLRGTTELGLFESGWYRISMVYFYILAHWFEWLGFGVVQARQFTALWGMVTVAAVGWIGLRHFNARVAIVATAVAALSGLFLQFSRETSEAVPTAALWTLSIALLLEGARASRSLPWILGGFAGAFSIYFYPTGRLWPLLAVLVGLTLIARWVSDGRGDITRLLRGLALAALAACVMIVPFIVHALQFSNEFALRFVETSVFNPANAARLNYVNPEWSTARLLGEQLARSLGILSHFADGGGFWPMHEPVMGPVLAALALLGFGASLLRVRDPRTFTLTLWFGVGMAGMVVTVETPNLQRMATAVPALALFAAWSTDEAVRRFIALFGRQEMRARAVVSTSLLLAELMAATLTAELRFYFVDYAAMNLWIPWNQEGRALNLLPPGTLTASLGQSFHMVNSGWVRLLAPQAERGGVRAPGSALPLPEEGTRDLAFLVYPQQPEYLAWLREIYPGSAEVPYALPGEEPWFTFLHVAAASIQPTRGAALTVAGVTSHVSTLGEPPADVPPSALPATWSATLRIPQQWNYAFRVAPGPARLLINEQVVLELAPGQPESTAIVQLGRGDHGLRLEATSDGAVLTWAKVPGPDKEFTPLSRSDLTLSDGAQQGWTGEIAIDGKPQQLRQDNALAFCCLGETLQSQNRPLVAAWGSVLNIESAGEYAFAARMPGMGRLTIDDATVLEVGDAAGGNASGSIALQVGAHPITLTLESETGANGALELSWTPPRGTPSILPASALTPPLAAGPLPALDEATLNTPDLYPVDRPLEVIE
jgi:hypothetical protein